MMHLLSWGRSQKSGKHVTFRNRNISYKLRNVQIQNVARAFNHHTWKVVPKRFLPPPLPVVHTRNGIESAKDDKDATYLSLYQNISLQNVLILIHF